ncbi:MAG: hypothetical protein NZZ41_04780, partial [Candidatus Dojkabacteria bacterium]|nr:hypothetical protein [Candidatus Dojkabacteria bacterium]
WYWYQLTLLDTLSFYERDDFVTQIEEEGTKEAWNVTTYTSNFSGIVLDNTHNTVQKSLEKLDSTLVNNINNISTLQTNTTGITGGLTQLNNTFVKKSGDTMTGQLTVQQNNIVSTGGTKTSTFSYDFIEIKDTDPGYILKIYPQSITFNNFSLWSTNINYFNIETQNYIYAFSKEGVLSLYNVQAENLASSQQKVITTNNNGLFQLSTLNINDIATISHVNSVQNNLQTQINNKQDLITLNGSDPIQISNTGSIWNFSFSGFLNGSVSNPSIFFKNSTNTGFYLSGNLTSSYVLNISLNGINSWNIEKQTGTNNDLSLNITNNNNILNNFFTNESNNIQFNFYKSNKRTWIFTINNDSYGNDANGNYIGQNLVISACDNSGNNPTDILFIERNLNRFTNIYNRLKVHRPFSLFASSTTPTGTNWDIGSIYFNTSANTISYWDGSSWQNIAASFAGFSNGSATSPSIYFSSETNTGFYRQAAGILAASILGTRSWSIDNNGVMSFLNGSTSSAFDNPFSTNTTFDPRFQMRTSASNDGTGIPRCSLALAKHDPNNGGTGPCVVLSRSKGNITTSYSSVSSSDILGCISFQGSTGSKFIQGSRIFSLVTSTPSSASVPSSLIFETTNIERMRITHEGRIGIGTSNPASILSIVSSETLPSPAANEVLIGGGAINCSREIIIQRSSGTSLLSLRTSDWNYAQVTFMWGSTQRGAIEVDNSGRFNIVGPATSDGYLRFLNGPSYTPHLEALSDIGVRVLVRSSDPPNSASYEGYMYYNNSTKKLRIYNGSNWVDV